MNAILPDTTRWVWFDLDNTLLDFDCPSLKSLHELWLRHNLGRRFTSEQTWLDAYHEANSALWSLYNNEMTTKEHLRFHRFYDPLIVGGFPTDEAEKMARAMDVEYLDLIAEHAALMPDALEVLTRLRERGMKIGVLSNGFSEVQYRRMSSVGIDTLIDCVVLSEEAGLAKPDPRIYDYALRRAAATPSQSVMVGDNPTTDIAGAVSARWSAAVLYIPPQYTDKIPPASAGATATIYSLCQLINV